jgi:ligand-binding SRPBCC domain-containing protein
LWHHQHHFREVEGGVEMIDIVHYGIGFGVLGKLMNSLVVKAELKKIFDYRREGCEKLFG